VAEEILFRGVVYPSLRRHIPMLAAMIASGSLFALIHGNWLGVLPITLLGVLLAYLYERTGSLLAPIAVHIFHNIFLISKVMLMNALLNG
jgi:membrane protease YdiL (CAAX protease family)